MTDLNKKYRPRRFEDVVGQGSIVESLKTALEEKAAHAFSFTGPSGTGKTTLARICATALGCAEEDLMEVDAATHTGVEAWREITKTLRYTPMSGGIKALIVDEAHMLSTSAWNSLLKDIEEPPPWVYWFFCTTEERKIPKTITTRCLSYALTMVSQDELLELLVRVCDGEEDGPEDEVLALVARNSDGSPRQAVSNLMQVWGATSTEHARVILRSASEEGEAIDLARALISGTGWAKAIKIIKTLEGQSPESVRQVVQAYLTKVAFSAKGDQQAARILTVLDEFITPFPNTNSMAPLIVAVGRILYGEE